MPVNDEKGSNFQARSPGFWRGKRFLRAKRAKNRPFSAGIDYQSVNRINIQTVYS
jgi:hypothetical protein